MPTMNQNSFVLRAAASSYVVFGIIFGGLTVFLLFVFIKVRQPIYPAAFPFTALFISYIWLHSYKLKITDGKLWYNSLLTKTFCISLDSIITSKIVTGYKTWDDLSRQPTRLVINYKTASETDHLSINIKIFKREKITQLMRILENRKLA